MSPIDAAIVRRKLGHIVAALDLLRSVADLGLDEYRARVWQRKGTERLLHRFEDSEGTPADRVELGGEVPDDYYGGFVKAGALGVLPVELARGLAPSAGLRNRLVHEYEFLDDGKILASVRTILDLYPSYVQAIERYLTAAGM